MTVMETINTVNFLQMIAGYWMWGAVIMVTIFVGLLVKMLGSFTLFVGVPTSIFWAWKKKSWRKLFPKRAGP